MAIELNKDKNDIIYYYSENDKTLGPYSLSEVLVKIDAETLVYREGIEWTNAKEIDELKKFFKEQQVKEDYASNTRHFASNTESIIEPVKMFAAPFSFDGRIRRTEYGISFIIYIISYVLIAATAKSSSFLYIAFIPLLWFLWAQGAKRCHDRGNSGWYQIIPFYVFWMLFAEGDSNNNEYGNSPK